MLIACVLFGNTLFARARTLYMLALAAWFMIDHFYINYLYMLKFIILLSRVILCLCLLHDIKPHNNDT